MKSSILFITFIYIFFNLGSFLDVTEEPKKADLIVCLGGNKDRIIKTMEIYEKGYLTTNKIILTGYENPKSYSLNTTETSDLRLSFINQEKYNLASFIYNQKLRNTVEEIIFVKKYMTKYNLKKVIFITEKPHSRRVSILFNILFQENQLEAIIVANDSIKWNNQPYYENKEALIYTLLEYTKIIHNLIFYKFFEDSIMFRNFKNYIDLNKSKITNYLRNSF